MEVQYDVIILNMLFTPVIYMFIPLLCLWINHGQFEQGKAKRIALWNSVVLGGFFLVLTANAAESGVTWNAGPAVLFFFINRMILEKKKMDEEHHEEVEESVEAVAIVHERAEIQPQIQVEEKQRLCVQESVVHRERCDVQNSLEPKDSKKKRRLLFWVILIVVLASAIVALMVFNITWNDSVATTNTTRAEKVTVRVVTFESEFMAEYAHIKWKNGVATEQSMIEIMEMYGSVHSEEQVFTVTPGVFVKEIDEWCFAPERKRGDTAVIKNVYGYTLCYFCGSSLT